MFYHAILGLLRDGRSRHGYDLISEYRIRAGRAVNPGNFYREFGKLVAHALIAPDANPPKADPRRIPYRITTHGVRDFDRWLVDPKSLQVAFDTWMLFADMLVPADRMRLVDELREELWVESKLLAATRERLVARGGGLGASRSYQPAALLTLRRIKRVTAELELIAELRPQLKDAPPTRVTVSAATSGASDGSEALGRVAARNVRKI